MTRSAMLRFSEDEFAERQARRERFQRGQTSIPERDILAAGLELLERHPAVAFAHRANTACGYLLRADVYHRLVAAGALKHGDARFMRFGYRGQPDISGMLRGSGRLLVAEAKADRGVVSDDQAAVIEAVNRGGGLGIVFRSVDELAEALA